MRSNNESKLSSSEFEQVFRSNYRVLFHLGYQISKDRELTKDVIQTLFLEFWDKRERLVGVENWEAYLRRSMHRKMIEVLKKEARQYKTQSHIEDEFQPSYEAILIKVQSEEKAKERLENAINDLPEAQREAIDLRFKEGLSYDEIATLTGKTKQTIYNQIFSAIQKLKDTLTFILFCFLENF
jgi:RNA polymerase sigma-70 factor (ECF subfamily)